MNKNHCLTIFLLIGFFSGTQAQIPSGSLPKYPIAGSKIISKSSETQQIIGSPLGLKDYKSTMLIGECVTEGSKTYFNNSLVKAQVLKDCETVTVQCYPAWGRWDETQRHVYRVDDFSTKVREMKKQQMKVTAHMLLGWDQYFPDWYKKNDFPADTLDAIMKSWLKGIIQYKGNDTLVDVWNVVNEAISWNGSGAYWPEYNADFNNACEMQHMGYEADASGLTGVQYVNAKHPIYIRKAFEYARTLTNKKLELRDASFEFPTDSKYKAFYQLATHLKKVGAPVDAIGFQTHLNLEQTYDWDGYASNIKRYIALGYEVMIPEVDVGDIAKTWSDDKAELQKMMYYRLITAAIKGGASDFQTWGILDDNNASWRAGQHGLLYTNAVQAKPAYYGITAALTDMSHILFWEMDAPKNNVMPDVMKYNNFGNLNNMGTPVPVSGFKNKAIQFDGVDDFISSGNLSDSISGNFTFSCFVKTSTTKSGNLADIAQEAASGLKIGITADGYLSLNAAEAGLPADLMSSAKINDGGWHFVALRREADNYSLYLDSSTAVATGKGSVLKFVKLVIGAKSDGTAAFGGMIDEVKLYDSAVEEASFTRNIVPFCPLKAALTLTGMSMKLSWADQSVNEEGYVVERKVKDGIWEERLPVLAASKLSFTETVTLNNTEYSYRVRAINKFGKSEPSLIKSALTPFATGINPTLKSGDSSISVFPNPARSTFTVISPENSGLKIFDIQGKLMLAKNNLSGNEIIDVSQFSNGIYVLKTNSGNRINEIKLIKN